MKLIYFREVKRIVKKRKKVFILAGMAVLLVITGVLNFKLNNNNKLQETATSATSASFFETYRIDRVASRDSQIEMLNEIIESSYTTAAEKSTATASKTALTQKMETELILEGLIKAKGFEDAIVTVGSNYYNVIIKDDGELTGDRVNQILSVIVSETGANAKNVKIVPIE